MAELQWKDVSGEWKDVNIVFIGNVKDVVLKKVAAIRLSPENGDGADEWIFISPNGSEFAFNNRHIVQVIITPHTNEMPMTATRDEITYDFSEEEGVSEKDAENDIDVTFVNGPKTERLYCKNCLYFNNQKSTCNKRNNRSVLPNAHAEECCHYCDEYDRPGC